MRHTVLSLGHGPHLSCTLLPKNLSRLASCTTSHEDTSREMKTRREKEKEETIKARSSCRRGEQAAVDTRVYKCSETGMCVISCTGPLHSIMSVPQWRGPQRRWGSPAPRTASPTESITHTKHRERGGEIRPHSGDTHTYAGRGRWRRLLSGLHDIHTALGATTEAFKYCLLVLDDIEIFSCRLPVLDTLRG